MRAVGIIPATPYKVIVRCRLHPRYPPIALQSISRDVPFAWTRAFQFSLLLSKGVAKVTLYCAHRTSTVSSCAFCGQGGHLAAPSSSFWGRALREHQLWSNCALFFPHPPWNGCPRRSSLRASREHCFIVRPPRARRVARTPVDSLSDALLDFSIQF